MRDWRGPIVLVLAVGVSTALVAGVLTAELTPTKVTSEEIAFLSTLGGAAVGAVAAYLGIRPTERRNQMTIDDPQPPEQEEPAEEPVEEGEPAETLGDETEGEPDADG